MKMDTKLVFAAPATLLICTLAARAQKAKIPVFQASTSLMQVTVLVTGRKGPITNLRASDFTLKDNGHERPIVFFSINDNRVAVAPQPPASIRSGAEKPQSNQGVRQPGMVVVLFDAADSAGGMQYFRGQPLFRSTLSFAWAKHNALAYLGKLPVNQDVELYALDSNLHLLASFTSQRSQLVTALKAYNPNVAEYADIGAAATGMQVPGGSDFDRRNEQAQERAGAFTRRTQAISTFQALSEIAASVAGLPGRTSLIWLLSRPPLNGELVEAALGHNNRIAVYPVDVRGLLTRDVPEPHNDNADQGVSFADSVARLSAQPIGQGTMYGIAQATGGRAFVNTNDIGGAIAAAAADSDYSYTLGFYLPAKETNSRFHKLSVKLHGVEHAELRYPHGFWATSAITPNRFRAVALLAAVHSPIEAAVIPLRAALTTDPARGDLHLSANLDVHGLRFTTAGGFHDAAVFLMTIEQDVQGNIIKGSEKLINIHNPDADYATLLKTGLQLQQPVPRLPGAVTVRLLAEDTATGAIGSIILPMPQKPPAGGPKNRLQ